ncbi:MAG TPA: bifunctional phosphoribosylaminoimidazolecarboxamide formyltransferase/IMP cyclohydrolase, partial [Thermoleophilaceae bacterium]|nr:bifunctional phosphoribosylaminoimidazolecarboxamide formyltransferase/IMP cyclohydrolase [Thermoleophilaceae bacterium]
AVQREVAEERDAVLEELRAAGGKLSSRTRESLAMAAFAYTASYDTTISRWFAERGEDLPSTYTRSFEKVLDLSYGENPHQRAAYYSETGARTHLLSMVSKLHGKELSFNNLLDLDSGRRIIGEFELPAVAIIKHNNPSGCALGADVNDAFDKALACDRESAFGGVFCFNRRIDLPLAQKLSELFVEVVFAPGFDDDALELLERKPNLRILDDQERRRPPVTEHDFKRVRGGLLVQDRDTELEMREDMSAVTRRKPTEPEWGEMLFATRVCKHVRSNAIVIAKDLGTVGVGVGQTSRVESVRLALDKARQAGLSLDGAVLASDAFFPFADGPQAAIDAGVRAMIQPGGSQRDHEVVDACDAAGVAMVFTARRHFRH